MKISVCPLYPTSNYLNVRIGIEQDFPDTHNIEDAVNVLWDCATAIHMKRYPHLYTPEGRPKYEQYQGDENPPNSIPAKVVEEPVDSIKGALEEINKCTTIEELGHCWIMSKGNLVLSQAYKEREKQLQSLQK